MRGFMANVLLGVFVFGVVTTALAQNAAPKAAPAGQADFKTTADKLLPEYHADRKAAKAKYQGKSIELTGKVVAVVREVTQDGVFTYEVVGGMGTLNSAFVTAKGNPLAKATPGQVVTFRGTFEAAEASVDPKILDAVVTGAAGVGAEPIFAKDLVTRLATKADQFRKQFDGKWLIVTAKVQRVTDAGEGIGIVVEEGKIKLTLGMSSTETDAVEALKPGAGVRVLVRYRAEPNEAAGQTPFGDGILLNVLPAGGPAPPKK